MKKKLLILSIYATFVPIISAQDLATGLENFSKTLSELHFQLIQQQPPDTSKRPTKVQPTAPTQKQEAAIQQADSLIKKANTMRPSPPARELIIQAIQTLRPFAPTTSAKIISIYNTRIQQLINARLGIAAREWLERALKEQSQLATAASGQPEFDAASKTLHNLNTKLKPLPTRRKRRGR